MIHLMPVYLSSMIPNVVIIRSKQTDDDQEEEEQIVEQQQHISRGGETWLYLQQKEGQSNNSWINAVENVLF